MKHQKTKVEKRRDAEHGGTNILVIIAIVVITVLLAAVVYLLFLNDPPAAKEKSVELQPIQKTEVALNQQDVNRNSFEAKDYIKDYTLYSLGDLIVNPAGAESRFFVTTITLEYRQADKKLPPELQSKTPKIKSDLMMYFSRRTVAELRDPENREVFIDDIMRMVNSILLEGRITDVLFEQYVIQ